MNLHPTHYLELVNFWLQTGIMEHSELSLKIIEYFPDIKYIYIFAKKKRKKALYGREKENGGMCLDLHLRSAVFISDTTFLKTSFTRNYKMVRF